MKIAVFDSGLGSLSIIKEIQNAVKSEIIYFADQKNFPYGKKSAFELEEIIKKTINLLERKFSPDLIIMASNTPTLLLNLTNERIIGVQPPLHEAVKVSKTKNIAILGTESVTKSKELTEFVNKCNLESNVSIFKINCSALIELVESGKFLTDKKFCEQKIRYELKKEMVENSIDVATLSSTHLPFLEPILKLVFDDVKFLDPAKMVVSKIKKNEKKSRLEGSSFSIFTSGDVNKFENNLQKLGIKNKVNFLTI